jgi:hypothetical protein
MQSSSRPWKTVHTFTRREDSALVQALDMPHNDTTLTPLVLLCHFAPEPLPTHTVMLSSSCMPMLLSGRGPSKTELTAFDGTLASKKYVPYKRRGDLVLAYHQWKLIMSFAKKKLFNGHTTHKQAR